MLSKDQLLEQLKLQDAMNCVVNPNWIKAGYLWTRAIMVEGNEALDHYGWKWWKKDNGPNVEQVRIELIDIWHFVLSNELVFTKGDHEAAAVNFLDAFAQPQYGLMLHDGTQKDLRMLDDRQVLHVLIGAAAFNDVHLTSLVLLMQRMGLTPDMLHKQYIQKNVLNLFRQANGYKEGTYVKMWAGREDNEVMASLVSSFPNMSSAELMAELSFAYRAVLDAPKEAT